MSATPLHQRIFKWVCYSLAGIIAVGALLDAFSNAISFVSPYVTYIASAFICLSWLSAEYVLKKFPVRWLVKGNQETRIQRLGAKPRFALLGAVLLLWIPRIVDWPKENRLNDEVNKVQVQNADLKKNIDRTLHPIKDVQISFGIYIPLDHSAVINYRKRIEQAVEEMRQIKQLKYEVSATNYTESGEIPAINIPAKSWLFPNRNSETLAYTVINYIGAEVEFYKMPINTNEYESRITKPELMISAKATLDNSLPFYKLNGPNSIANLVYDLKSHHINVEALNIPSDPATWENSGQIVSIPDLAGTQVVIRFFGFLLSNHPDVVKYAEEIRRTIEIRGLRLNMSGGREFQFGSDKLKRYVDKHGNPFYICNFPES